MMLVYSVSAMRDLRRIAIWYRKNRPAYEARFFERLRATLRRIEQTPANCPIVLAALGLRRARVLRSPYAVVFAVMRDHVRIVGVLHGARHPALLSRRLREGGTR
jgi:plasmid stabilization system protein ParE